MTTLTYIALNAAFGGTVVYGLLRLLVAGIRPDVRSPAAGELGSSRSQSDRLAA